MDKLTRIGLDLAKNVFHLIGFNARDKEIKKKMLRRSQMLSYFAQLPPCLIGMEACASAHYWARELEQHGHTVRLIPPQHVKPYLRGKNDYNDARAIAEAVTRPGMHFVAIKTPAQLDVQALYRQCLSEYFLMLSCGVTALFALQATVVTQWLVLGAWGGLYAVLMVLVRNREGARVLSR